MRRTRLDLAAQHAAAAGTTAFQGRGLPAPPPRLPQSRAAGDGGGEQGGSGKILGASLLTGTVYKMC